MYNVLRVIFAGTSDFAAYHLNALINSQHKIVGVLTKPDLPAGRGKKITFSKVKLLAKQFNLLILQPISLNQSKIMEYINQLKVDIIVVSSYGLIFPKTILDIPKFGCINIHASLLPRWRGAAPIQRALLAGDQYTGITIIQMNVTIDTGDILNQYKIKIYPNDTTSSLCKKLSIIGSNILLMTLEDINFNRSIAVLQNNIKASYAKKLVKEEAKLNWNLSAIQLERCIRAFNPWPVSYFFLKDKLIKVWSANVKLQQNNVYKPGTIINTESKGIHVTTGKGILILTKLQVSGKKQISAKDFINASFNWLIPGMLLK